MGWCWEDDDDGVYGNRGEVMLSCVWEKREDESEEGVVNRFGLDD